MKCWLQMKLVAPHTTKDSKTEENILIWALVQFSRVVKMYRISRRIRKIERALVNAERKLKTD